MLQKIQFYNLIIYVSVAFLITLLLGVISMLINKKTKKNSSKLLSYETGCLPANDTANNMNIHFYIIGIIFLILDIEIVLLFPWVLSLKFLGIAGFYKVLSIFLILGLGFSYEWVNGSLKWIKSS